MKLLERARACVATRPPAIEGSGGNATTFSVACLLVWGFGLEPDQAMPLMLEYNATCAPPWPQRDLERMCRNALNFRHDKPRGHMAGEGLQMPNAECGMTNVPEVKHRKKSKYDLDRLKQAQAPGLPTDMAGWRVWLKERCAHELDLVGPTVFLDGLYEKGEKILVFNRMWGTQGDYGRVIGKGWWKLNQTPYQKPEPITELPKGSPEGMTFLMQPTDASWHPVTKPWGAVEMSRRTKASVTRWPYILLESDKAPHELWLNAMVRAKIRIVAIIASGGRSLHALVRLDKETEAELLDEVKDPDNEELLTLLGCDPQAMHGMVYPRLPNTWREGKRMSKLDADGKPMVDARGKRVMHFVPFKFGSAKQTLLYFNPAAERGRCIAEGMIYARS